MSDPIPATRESAIVASSAGPGTRLAGVADLVLANTEEIDVAAIIAADRLLR